VLVSQTVVDASGDVAVSFRAIRPVEFKGALEPIELLVVSRHG
jgi:hypothetical protein